MNGLRVVAAAVLLVCAGGSLAAFAGDPFEDAIVAVRWKENEKALALIDTPGFDVNRQNAEGYTLLHIAADQNNFEMAKILLQRGANPNLRSKIGSTVADMAYSGSPLLAAVLKAGGQYAKNAPYVAPASRPATAAAKSASGATRAPASAASAAAASNDPRRKQCNARHHSSSALCSDSTCKMREYRKWQTCLKTGSYN
ncbi:ankyrin repeat domain-containing protein [Sphingomonas parva]|uniref:Ankyrin repeat domain-containing protein n=1 Tax=Sphingomonas parva TaxID=2555898 RepID=A0A4Y8ZM55_9SPHN|nr:ankyrin repeat domain-containing protein [Sphingomonas parva]TFI57034.1 ankyrin repeat domain-containing protein [Sphingomonas parva]